MVRPRSDLTTVVEMALAFVVGAIWYAAVTALLARPLPESTAVTAGVVCLSLAVVLATAHWWDVPYATTIGVASVVALDWNFIPPTHPIEVPRGTNAVALTGYLLMATLLGELAVRARRRAVQVEEARSTLAGEQDALRRVATLVARQPAPQEVFDAVTEEVGRQLDADLATMIRYDSGGHASVAATWADSGPEVPVGTSLSLEGDHLAATVRRTGRPARIDSYERVSGSWADDLRSLGVRASAGCPITVDGTVWGVMVVASRSPDPFPPGTERRLGEFTELVATAVANAQARTDLVDSRARLVAAGDDARRRIERDLHDGVQQRLVSLALDARLVRRAAGDGTEVGARLAGIETGLLAAVDELRDLSHGIHPAVLTDGGLGPALRALARRSPVPVDLDADDVGRLPGPTEVGLYYVVSEGLTNVAKHAGASVVRVTLEADAEEVRLTVEDDGAGGIGTGSGSGLVGLADRVHALGGRFQVTSPRGVGTTLVATVPVAGSGRGSGVALGEDGADRVG